MKLPETGTPIKTRSQKPLFLLLILLVAIIVVLALFTKPRNRGTTEVIGPGQEKYTAPVGTIVPGFPDELAPESDAVIKESYSITYTESDVNQPVVRYVSNRTLEENITSLRSRLIENDWMITHEANPSETPSFFYAEKEGGQLNIILEPQQDGVAVTIAYSDQSL